MAHSYSLVDSPLQAHTSVLVDRYAATSSWVDSGFAPASLTSAPAMISASTRTEVSLVTWRQTPSFTPSRGLDFAYFSAKAVRAFMCAFAQRKFLSPAVASFTSATLLKPLTLPSARQ